MLKLTCRVNITTATVHLCVKICMHNELVEELRASCLGSWYSDLPVATAMWLKEATPRGSLSNRWQPPAAVCMSLIFCWAQPIVCSGPFSEPPSYRDESVVVHFLNLRMKYRTKNLLLAIRKLLVRLFSLLINARFETYEISNKPSSVHSFKHNVKYA